MGDLIDRQDAIDRINKQREHLRPDIYSRDKICDAAYRICAEFIERLPSAQPTQTNTPNTLEALDCISRKDAVDIINGYAEQFNGYIGTPNDSEVYAYARGLLLSIERNISALPSAQPDLGKYEYHYDHTDCIWYRPEARNRCPSTCAQYRDGWNDAMNYIFRDGKGYRPYRRDRRYEDGDSN